MQWAGHVDRMEEGRILKKLLNRRMQEARPNNRPRRRWEETFDEDTKELFLMKSWKRVAKGREAWWKIL